MRHEGNEVIEQDMRHHRTHCQESREGTGRTSGAGHQDKMRNTKKKEYIGDDSESESLSA